jgi:beta-1,2-mannobiose phosphorylase / 1,2-beta-oligomannan phosphorylase
MNFASESPFRVERLGVIMRPDRSRDDESEGVLNPAAARGPDGELYLFPRLIGRGNYSRIGIARVLFDEKENPIGVERLGYALEPEEPYELRPSQGTGGCEDPRVTYLEPLNRYVMTYVAWGPSGPRIALAVSENLLAWERLGLVDFQPDVEAKYGAIFNNYHNRDAAFFPHAITLEDGTVVLGMLHRLFYGDPQFIPRGIRDPLPSIWVTGCELEWALRDIHNLRFMRKHALLVDPQSTLERLRIGTSSGRTPRVFLMIYHGLSNLLAQTASEKSHVEYVAGMLVVHRDGEQLTQYHSPSPIAMPQLDEEPIGTVNNVVFPTGVDDREDGTLDIYYGADRQIKVARLYLPERIELEADDALQGLAE